MMITVAHNEHRRQYLCESVAVKIRHKLAFDRGLMGSSSFLGKQASKDLA
jgi:hypothetical protein